MRSALIIAAIACVALADLSLEFLADANLTDASANFAFRYSLATVKTINLILVKPKFMVWSSASVQASASSTEKAKGDGMVGCGILPSARIPPMTLFAYGNGAAAVDVDADSMLSKVFIDKASLEAEFQGSAVAVAALDLREVDKDGKTVGDIIPIRPSILCEGEEISGDEGNVTGLTCNFKAKKDVEITVTYVTSKKAGILGYGNTPVSPRSVEMIIEVKNFPLKDDANHVRLDLGFLAVTAGIDLNASATEVIRREGKEDIYIAASERAVVGDNLAKVNVTIEAKAGDVDVDDILKAVLKVALGASFDARIAHVDFPAGAKSFIYDPALGAGTAVYDACADSATTAALSLLIALICALVYLF